MGGYQKLRPFIIKMQRQRLQSISNPLETEKSDFVAVLNEFIDNIDFEQEYFCGRPGIDLRDILKCLLVMSYYGMSYRRSLSDMQDMFQKGFISFAPKRSTIAKYMLDKEIKEILKVLIPLSARTFMDIEDTILVDSSWWGKSLPLSGRHKRHVNSKRSYFPLDRTRKLHVMCFLKTQIIACVRVSAGTINDHSFFDEMIKEVIDNGFNVKRLIGDAGYSGKRHTALLEDLNIKEVFIDFKKNATFKKPRSFLWKERLKLYRENPEVWHESYRFRVIIENLFSSMKRKGKNYIRCRKPDSQDVELLLKAMVHNLIIIAKFVDSL